MKHIFDDYINVLMAVIRTIIGRIFLFISACLIGAWISMGFFSMIFNLPHNTLNWSDLLETPMVLFFINGMGILGLYGIPFIIIQVICFYQIIIEEKNLLHGWFAAAYCQATLTYLFLSIPGGYGFLSEHAIDFAIAVLFLGAIHAFITWVMIWRNKTPKTQELP